MKNYHKAAIDILSKTKTEAQWYELLIKIAKNNPHALVRAYSAIEQTPSWQYIAMCSNNNSEAVRACRAETGASLKDAVNMVKALPGRSW